MKVNMKVTYDRADVCEAMKECYVKKFGQVPDGFELVATMDYSDNVTVETMEKEEEELPPPVDVPEPDVRDIF